MATFCVHQTFLKIIKATSCHKRPETVHKYLWICANHVFTGSEQEHCSHNVLQNKCYHHQIAYDHLSCRTRQNKHGLSSNLTELTAPVSAVTMCQTRNYSSDSYDHDPDITVDKQLLNYMDMWLVDDAVSYLRASVDRGIIPSRNVVHNLLQQLANLGEVDCLLELDRFLIDHSLCSSTAFYRALQQAYYYSGRIDEGVAVLRLLYHRTRKYQDIDAYFTLLSVMVIKHFPHKIPLIEDFIRGCFQNSVPDNEPGAAFWKCLVLTGECGRADDWLAEHEQIHQFLPVMINDIYTKRNKVDVDRTKVLHSLLDISTIRQTQRIPLYEAYLQELVDDCDHTEFRAMLEKAHSQNLKLHPERIHAAWLLMRDNIEVEQYMSGVHDPEGLQALDDSIQSVIDLFDRSATDRTLKTDDDETLKDNT